MVPGWLEHTYRRYRLRRELARRGARRLLNSRQLELFVTGRPSADDSVVIADVERARLSLLEEWMREDFGFAPRRSLRVILICADDEGEFYEYARFLKMPGAERFSAFYTGECSAAVLLHPAGTEAFQISLFHETAHALSHAGYGTLGMFWAIEGYAEALVRRFAREACIEGADAQDRAYLSLRREEQGLSLEEVVFMSGSTHGTLDWKRSFCFQMLATLVTDYLLDEAKRNPAARALWRRAIVKGFRSPRSFQRALKKATGMTISELEREVIARLEIKSARAAGLTSELT